MFFWDFIHRLLAAGVTSKEETAPFQWRSIPPGWHIPYDRQEEGVP